MTTYSMYQLTCGYNSTPAEFKECMFDLLDQYYNQTSVCVTVNSIIFSESMYSGKYPCKGEPVALVFLSINPNRHPEDARPHIEWIANKLATQYDQHVVPCSAISPSNTVFVGKK